MIEVHPSGEQQRSASTVRRASSSARLRRVRMRHVRPSDRPALQSFYAGLSAASRQARFLGAGTGLTDSQALSFCAPDHRHAEGFIAELDKGRIVGHLCLEPAGLRRLELAVAVADEWQGQGIGRALFEAALRWAQSGGYEAILASAYADNTRVLRLLSSAPLPAVTHAPSAGVVTLLIPLVAPLPQPWRRVPAAAGVAPRRRRAAQAGRAARPSCCRVVWRRRRRPAPVAAG